VTPDKEMPMRTFDPTVDSYPLPPVDGSAYPADAVDLPLETAAA
jgi:hypothetical protein